MKEYLYELYDVIESECEDMAGRLRTKSVPLSEKSVEYVDKLTHIMKSLQCVIAMEEDKEQKDHSYKSMRESARHKAASEETVKHLEQALETVEDDSMRQRLHDLLKDAKMM